jgi:hypothetical protein
MTLVEFLAPLHRASYRDQCLSVLYFEQRYRDETSRTANEVRSALRSARMPKAARINVPDVLAKSGALVDIAGRDGGRIYWRLTESGEKHVRALLGLPAPSPEVDLAVSSLTDLLGDIEDEGVRGYVDEAIKCLSVRALRAAVVFLWTGAIRSLQQRALDEGATKVQQSIAVHDPKARPVSRLDDFAYVKDVIQLRAFQTMGLVDKSEAGVLAEGLDLRNKCGHPGKYRPREKKVEAFIEDIVGIVF